LFGKILGLSTVLLINSVVLGALSVFLFINYGGEYQELFAWAIYFSFLEAFTVLVFAVFFSLLTNTTLSVVFTMTVFVAGHAINETSKLLFVKFSDSLGMAIKVIFFVLPNFYRLNLKDYLLYQQTIASEYLWMTQLYIAFYLLALVSAVLFIFKNKNLD
jgi:hypothetical protein